MKNPTTSGHRQRLRDRFMGGDNAALTDEALLELLLTFSIPQKDLQPLSKELIRQYGSLSSVLDASPTSLEQANGIKSSSTVLIKLVDTILKTRGTIPPSIHNTADAPKATQQNLFESAPSIPTPVPNPVRKPSKRNGTGLFSKSAVKDAVALLPRMPLTDSLDEVLRFLKTSLPYNSVQTRERYSQYFRSQMFQDGYIDPALIQFARIFPSGQDIKDACLYRFCRAEPLAVDFVDYLTSSKGGAGTIGRDFILHYLQKRFPGAASADDCAAAIISGFEAADIFRRKGKELFYAPRSVSIPAFAYILHNEFPEPGIYDISQLEKCRRIRPLHWKIELILPSLYELRNRGLISKVSEIDNVRLFTTKWTLSQVVDRLAGMVNP